jgi:hypothetical protein
VRPALRVTSRLPDLDHQRVCGYRMGQEAAVPRHFSRGQVSDPLGGEHKPQPRPAFMHAAG